jgi:hypothetical protein
MDSHGIVHPAQLSMLAEALERYCRDHHIEPGTLEHEAASTRIVALFENGVSTVDDLVAALDPSKRPQS